jgi:PPK2 family polyphosphate:nucleotide phosphotransferase
MGRALHNSLMGRTHVVDGKVNFSKIKTNEDGGLTKEQADAKVAKLGPELYELQELLFAAGTHSLLLVLQGIDTSGKEGAIGSISKATNVHGVQVSPFKEPTEEDLAHDFLWRIHQKTPAKGMIGIFNRSHYEDVLVVRVHDIVPKSVWKERYEHIKNFEKLLADSSTIIVKFYLHISKEEQRQRLLAREADPTKAWKLGVGDWKERELWSDYMEAYEEALSKTSTQYAPWYIVPSDHKWYRNLTVIETLIDTLKPYKKTWMKDLAQVGEQAKSEILAYRRSNKRK